QLAPQMLRLTVAVIAITLALALDVLAAAYLPPGYTIGLSLLVPLAAFAAIAWGFMPTRSRAVPPLASRNQTHPRSARKTHERPAACPLTLDEPSPPGRPQKSPGATAGASSSRPRGARPISARRAFSPHRTAC